MALEEYGYEVRFALSANASSKEIDRVYKLIEAFEKQLRKSLTLERTKLRQKSHLNKKRP